VGFWNTAERATCPLTSVVFGDKLPPVSIPELQLLAWRCDEGGTISQEEAHFWRERCRLLFDRNVAGTVLTNVEGSIIDCNEPCARIFGFESRSDMLAHSAWDFYFDKTERNALIDRLRSRGNCPAEEVCLRGKNGVPVWLLTIRTVADFAKGRPELLLSTAIDITAQKKAQASLGAYKVDTSSASRPERENTEMARLSQRLAILLQCANQAIQPYALPQMGRPEIQEFLLVLEEMKMLMSELEILRLFGK
jgi:PAS domain S-box-containing protein